MIYFLSCYENTQEKDYYALKQLSLDLLTSRHAASPPALDTHPRHGLLPLKQPEVEYHHGLALKVICHWLS